jgi:hypothetical protein
VVRKLRVDLTLLERFRGLEVLSVAFAGLVVFAFLTQVRSKRR